MKVTVGGVLFVSAMLIVTLLIAILSIQIDNKTNERASSVASAQINAYCAVSTEDRAVVSTLIKALKANLPVDGEEAWNHRLPEKTSAALEAAANGKFDCSKQ